MKVKDYERNQRKMVLRSEKPKETVCTASGDVKRTYYDEGKVYIIGHLLQRMLDGLFIEGYLTNEIKVSVEFKETETRGEIFAMDFKVLE